MLNEKFLAFCDRIHDDPRISPRHISLYLALLFVWENGGNSNPFAITRQEIMRIAKISARHTYNCCMHDLDDFGYIVYTPSSDPRIRAKVFLLFG